MSKNHGLITHHIFPANIHKNGGKKGGETVDICPKFEKMFHQVFGNMSPGQMFVFKKVLLFDQREKKWTKRRIGRLRMAIIEGNMSPENRILSDLIDSNQLETFIELTTMMYIFMMSFPKRQSL